MLQHTIWPINQARIQKRFTVDEIKEARLRCGCWHESAFRGLNSMYAVLPLGWQMGDLARVFDPRLSLLLTPFEL